MEKKTNFKEESARKVISGENPMMGMSDTFEFDCVQCGKCCRNRNDILLNPLDVFRLCKGLGTSFADFAHKYAHTYRGESSKLPLVRIKFRETVGIGFDKGGTRCPFLRTREGLSYCEVHAFKPFVCYSYPLGRIARGDESDVKYFLQSGTNCAGAAKAHREGSRQNVSDWLRGEENLSIETKFNEIYYGFLKSFRGWINIDELAKTGELYDRWSLSVAVLLYENYDYSQDENGFIEQFSKRISLIKELCNSVIKEGRGKANLLPKKR